MPDFLFVDGLRFAKDKNTGYYLNAKHLLRLHRYVFERDNKIKIPKGYDVHHIDFDKDNNDISNLQLLKRSEHLKLHYKEKLNKNPDHVNWLRKNLEVNARPKASEWHGTEEGRAWHVEHAKEVAKNMKEVEYTCKQCGVAFSKKPFGANKFCSNGCKSKWRLVNKIDHEDRVCAFCGKVFSINKYYKTKCCSKSCSCKAFPRLPNCK